MTFIIQFRKTFVPMAMLASVTACTPETVGDGNGLEETLNPSFSVTPAEGQNNTYIIKNTTPGAIVSRWDLDNGAGFARGKMTETVFYPDAGTYTVRLQAMGKGGTYYDAAESATINVATSDPVAGNLVQGGKMNPEDADKWTHIFMSASRNITFNLENGKMVAKGGNGGHAAIYQPIQVQAGKKYRFGMIVSGSGATNTWFEVYFGKTQPVNEQDYNNGGKKFGLNTWAGCGNAPFNGNINVIGCDAELANKNGEITFAESGTVYLLIKTGGADLGTSGISIDNVELRGM